MPIPSGVTGELIIKKYFQSEDWEKAYPIRTANFKHISTYTGLNFNEIRALPFYQYCLYLRDSWIYTQKQSEEGRNFLKDLKDLTQSTPDYNQLRKVVNHEKSEVK